MIFIKNDIKCKILRHFKQLEYFLENYVWAIRIPIFLKLSLLLFFIALYGEKAIPSILDLLFFNFHTSWKEIKDVFILCQKHVILRKIENFTFMTLPWPDLRQKSSWILGEMTVTINIYVQDRPENICLTAGLWLSFLVTFVAWPWPWL